MRHLPQCGSYRLLNKRSLWSNAERDIIEAYRRQHIKQQFDERIKLQQNIAGTYELDVNRRPESALVLGDGMTAYTGTYIACPDRIDFCILY